MPQWACWQLFRSLGAVLGAGLLTILYRSAVKSTTDDMVTNPREVLYTTTTHEHNAVFLEVMTFTADVGNDFLVVREPNPGHFSKCGVGLLGCLGLHLKTDATALRAALKRRGLGPLDFG